MDFDRRKKDMMKKLSSVKRDKVMHRKDVAARARLKGNKILEDQGKTNRVVDASNKPPVLVYGTQGLFFGTLKSSLAPYCDVRPFTNAEEATEYIIENKIPLIVMDMDPPTDWKMCHDLFTTGKTMYPDTEYIVYQKDDNPRSEVKILEAQGAHIMKKPVDRVELVAILKRVILGSNGTV